MSGKKTKTTGKNLLTNSNGQHGLGVYKANGALKGEPGRKGPGCAGWRHAEPPGGLAQQSPRWQRAGRAEDLRPRRLERRVNAGKGIHQSEAGNPGEARARPRGRRDMRGGSAKRPGSQPRVRMEDTGSSTSNAVQKSRNASTAKSPEFGHSRSEA